MMMGVPSLAFAALFGPLLWLENLRNILVYCAYLLGVIGYSGFVCVVVRFGIELLCLLFPWLHNAYYNGLSGCF